MKRHEAKYHVPSTSKIVPDKLFKAAPDPDALGFSGRPDDVLEEFDFDYFLHDNAGLYFGDGDRMDSQHLGLYRPFGQVLHRTEIPESALPLDFHDPMIDKRTSGTTIPFQLVLRIILKLIN